MKTKLLRVTENSLCLLSRDFGKIKLIADEPTLNGGLDFAAYSKLLENIIRNSKSKFTIGIFGEWGSGKSSLMRMIQYEIDKNEKKQSDENKKILTVWFDAWKYEREEFLAVIPFLRTIKISLEESQNSRIGKWERVTRGLDLTLKSFISSTKISYGIKDILSIETDFGKFMDNYKAADSLGKTVNILYYDANLFLEKALKDLRTRDDKTIDDEFRIVAFIDDLDRCSPDKALEVLESIKTFFDIEGFVFVVGMNYKTIDTLIKKKFKENPNITGYQYIGKIVQLPFRIPNWTEYDISNFIKHLISEELIDSPIAYEFEENREIFIKGLTSNQVLKSNPRELKRHLNKIILANSIYHKPLKQLFVVQALASNPEWKDFLEFMTSDEQRHMFLRDYMRTEDGYSAYLEQRYPDILKRYPSMVQSQDPLSRFLRDGAANILLEIMGIEEYRRLLSSVDLWIDSSV